MLRLTFSAIAPTTLAMTDDNFLPFSFPAVSRKQITAAFDGGRLTSDGGVMLLAMAEPVVDKSKRCLGGAEVWLWRTVDDTCCWDVKLTRTVQENT